MSANTYLISCNFSSSPLKTKNFFSYSSSFKPSSQHLNKPQFNYKAHNLISPPFHYKNHPHLLQIRHSSLEPQNVLDKDEEEQEEGLTKTNNRENEEENDWTTSLLLFVFWGGLMYYVTFIAPNQTPATDMYLVQKLSNLKGDDGFQVNQVIVNLWYLMALWPLLYCMLLHPTARSSKSKVPVWPFTVLSFLGGAYVLIPYFVLWKPPPPPVEESELKKWPLNFLESKLTSGFALVAGLGLLVSAGLSNADVWKEFFQYFGGSKLVHATGLDFCLCSAFAPFWVYNDMTTRKWYDKGFWLLPLSVIPFLGPALYLLLRPSLSEITQATIELEGE